MTRFVAIAAVGRHGELGLKGDMPWGHSLKKDLKFFKEQTMGHPVIMGRRTWDPFPRPLPGRENIVITRRPFEQPGVTCYPSIEEALADLEKREPDQKVYVIGGGSIYAALVDQCDELVLTEIESDFDADTWFPEFDRNAYERTVLGSQEENGFSYSHVRYVRKPE